MTIRAFHHFALVVADLDGSVGWYGAMLGFTTERRFGFPDAGVEIAHLIHPSGVRLELIRQEGSVAGPDVGLDAFGALRNRGAKHVGFLVDDIEATERDLRARGAAVVHDVTAVPPAGVRNFWVRDGEDNLIEFNQWL